MIYRITPFISFILILTIPAFSQLDSLVSLTQNNNPDTVRIDAYNQLSRAVLGSNPDSSIFYSQSAAGISEEISDFSRTGTSYKNVGLGYYYKADFVKVLEFWTRSLEAFEKAEDAKGVANLLSNLGAVYYTTGDNSNAVDYYLRAQRIAEESGDDLRLATVLQNLGAVYESTKEFDKAESYLLQAIEISKLLEYDKGIGTMALNLGDIYMQQEKYDLAETYLEMARSYLEKTDDNYLATPIMMMGRIEAEKANYNRALEILNSSKAIASEKDDMLGLSLSFNAMGDVYLKMGRANSALGEFQQALSIGQEIGVTEDLRETYAGLVRSYKLLGNYSKASQFQDSLLKTNLELYNNEKDKTISNLELSFDLEKKESEIELLNADNKIKTEQIARARLFRNFLMAIAALLVFVIGGVAYQYNYVKKTNKIITDERNKSDSLLLNILPEETADELKKHGKVQAKKFDHATVLFTDFVNFTGTAGKMDPEHLVKSVDYYFRNFDEIIKKYNLEKIKTIGDAYMCAGGIPKEDLNNTRNALLAAGEIISFVEQTALNPPEGITPFQIRIGLNSGPLVAGVVGSSKFQYDVWGDTVNIASRMESNSAPNRVNVSESIYESLKHDLEFEYRGEIDVKNKGKLKMYFFDHLSAN